MRLPRYKASFKNSIIAKASLEEKDEDCLSISKASLSELKSLMPKEVDLERNIDLLGVSFNVAVANLFNANGDGIDTDTALEIAKYFVHKQANIEHKRSKVVGHVVSSGFSTYGENKIITPSELSDSYEPFNIALSAVVYRIVNKQFADALEKSTEKDSNLYQQISTSWELGYEDYIIALGSKKLSECEIVTDPKLIKELSNYIISEGGTGKLDDGTLVSRLVVGDVYPLGFGFTTNPAADVKGVTSSEDENEDEDKLDEKETYAIQISNNLQKIKKNISHFNKNSVKNKQGLISIMDLEQVIAKIEALFKEHLPQEDKGSDKEVQASKESIANVSKDVANVISEFGKEWKSEAEKSKQEAEASKQKLSEVEQNLESLKQELESANEKINSFEQAKAEAEAEEVFNARMEDLYSQYDFSDSEKEVIASEVGELAIDEQAYEAYKSKVSALFSHRNKEVIAKQKEEFEKQVQERVAKELEAKFKESNASKADETEDENDSTDEALQNAQQSSASVPNGNAQEEDSSISSKFKNAFKKENIQVSF